MCFLSTQILHRHIILSSFHAFSSTYNFAPHSHIIIHHSHFHIHVCHSFHSCLFRLEFAFPKINIYSVARMLYKQPLTLSKCVGFVCSCVPTIPLFSNPFHHINSYRAYLDPHPPQAKTSISVPRMLHKQSSTLPKCV